MSNVVPFVAYSPDQEKLWWAFVSAAEKAQRSKDIQDGIAAGKAWAAFLKVFAPQSRR